MGSLTGRRGFFGFPRGSVSGLMVIGGRDLGDSGRGFVRDMVHLDRAFTLWGR